MDISAWLRRSLLAIVTLVSLAPAIPLAAPDETRPEPGPALLQLSFISPVQLVWESRDVTGLRLTLFYGKNADVSGLDIAFGPTQSATFSGVQFSYFGNWVKGNASGVQLSGFVSGTRGELKGVQASLILNAATRGGTGVQIGGSNIASGKFTGAQNGWLGNGNPLKGQSLSVTGVQIAPFNAVPGSVTGLQVGAVNGAASKEGSFTGVQVSVLNVVGRDCAGLQIGVVNGCKDMRGVQIGVFNASIDMRGVQIGLVNHIKEGAVKWLPIVNAKF